MWNSDVGKYQANPSFKKRYSPENAFMYALGECPTGDVLDLFSLLTQTEFTCRNNPMYLQNFWNSNLFLNSFLIPEEEEK